MAAVKIEAVVVVACSKEELLWVKNFFQKTDEDICLSYGQFSEEVTDFSMQDEPEFAHKLIMEVYEKFNSVVFPDLVLFFSEDI